MSKSTVKTGWILTVAVIAASATALAQSGPGQPANSRRNDIRLIEVILTNAVKQGAETLGRQMQVSEPGSLIVTGTARARGFVLDGYGVFFDVDVPMMKQSVVWSMQTLMREKSRRELRAFIATNPDGPARRWAEAQLRNLDQQGGAAPSQVAQSATSEMPAKGMAKAATVPETVITPAPDPRDPNELYTEAVKSALIDAMLKVSGQMIGPDEWLTVAAQDAEGPLPGQIYDASTIVLRVKGSDLAAYQGGKLTKEEVMKKVEVREF